MRICEVHIRVKSVGNKLAKSNIIQLTSILHPEFIKCFQSFSIKFKHNLIRRKIKFHHMRMHIELLPCKTPPRLFGQASWRHQCLLHHRNLQLLLLINLHLLHHTFLQFKFVFMFFILTYFSKFELIKRTIDPQLLFFLVC